MNTPKTTIAAASAAVGITSASAAWRHGPERSDAIAARSDLADHALDQIVHLLEHHVGLLERGPRGDDGVARVVLQRTLEDDEVALHHLRLHGVGVLARRVAHRTAVGAGLDEAFLQAAAHEVVHRFAGHRVLHVRGVRRGPIPLGAGQIALGGQRRLIGVIAADEDATALRGLDDHLRAVDVTGDDVHALVDQAVGGLGFLDRQGPVAGDDQLRRDLRIDRARAHGEGVDVPQYLWDRLGGDEAELLRLGGVAGDDAVQVLALVDVAEVAADVLRMLALGPETAAVGEADLGILLGHPEDVRIEVAERRREQERRAVLLDHRPHRLLHVGGVRDLLLLDHRDAGHLLEGGGRLGLRLVVAVVVAWADVDDAHDQLVGCERTAGGRERAERPRPREAQQELPTIELSHEVLHSGSLFEVSARRISKDQARQGVRLTRGSICFAPGSPDRRRAGCLSLGQSPAGVTNPRALDGAYPRTVTPPLITRLMRRLSWSRVMSRSGSPSTKTRSAHLPFSIVPISAWSPRHSAARLVAACSACIGVIPAETSSAGSSAFAGWPWPPASVPATTFTPAASARPTLSTWCARSA